MNWKEFFKPSILKIVIFLLIILIFGIPATSHSCSTYPLRTMQPPPPCIDKFGLQNLLYIFLESMPATDAYTNFIINYFYLIGYLVLVYLVISVIFNFIPKKKE
jgi:hypothetical protein